ncbi:MAG: plastocyanin/azurin family copper-binding protein [Actinomycetota bacterium]
MTRRLLACLFAGALLLPACGREDSGPRRYVIEVDAKSTAEAKVQYSAYYPAALRLGPGDSIRFRNQSTEAPHTISFGINADRSNQPPILTDTGENPVVVEPCDIDDLPTNELLECDTSKLGAFDGQGYWNSGFLMPQPAPKDAGDKAVTLSLANDIPAGEYTYVCILHPFMSGQITVIEEGEDRSAPADIKKEGSDAIKVAKQAAADLTEPELEEDGDTVTAAAGWGDKTLSVNRFAPAEIEVDAGTTVRWAAQNPYEPHTVTFDPPDDANPFAPPGGVEGGSSYSGGFAHSGLYGAEGTPFAGEFSLRFTEAGDYDYVCLLHPGMAGSVKVT